MGHYDLYEALGVSPGLGTGEIADHLTSRLADRPSQAHVDELRLALDVIGDDERRPIYDRQLRNPSAPEITVEAVRQLASRPGRTATEIAASPPAVPSSTTTGHRGEERKRPQWFLPAGIGVVIVMFSVAAITWMMVSDDDPSGTTEEAAIAFSTTPEDVDRHSDPPRSSADRTPEETTQADIPHERREPSREPSTGARDYGAGLQSREVCGGSNTAATFVIAGKGTAQCNFANYVGDRLADTVVREGSRMNITVHSPNQNKGIPLSCRKAQDSNRDFLWKCTVDSSGSVVYVYP